MKTKPATENQKNLLRERGISFDADISLEDAREMLLEGKPDPGKRNTVKNNPALFSALMVRSEMDNERRVDGVNYLPY